MTAYIETHRGRFGVEPICRVLGVSASACYQRKTRQRSLRVVDDERMLGVIRELHLANDALRVAAVAGGSRSGPFGGYGGASQSMG